MDVRLPPQVHLMQWAGEASVLIGDIFDAASKRFTKKSFPDSKEGLTLWQLQASCHMSAESTLLLVSNLRLWDADILVRSVTEGSFKFFYLVIGDANERKDKLHEFEHMLFEISELKRHTRLDEFLKAVKNPDAPEWRGFRDLLLTPERVAQIRAQYPKDRRRLLDQKWSFGEICAAFYRHEPAGLGQLRHMMYNYGMSSHVAHQDITGISIVWDRNNRSVERRSAVELAHGARLISDVCIMSWFRAYMLFNRCGLKPGALKKLWSRSDKLHKKMAWAHAHFHAVEYGAQTNDSASSPPADR